MLYPFDLKQVGLALGLLLLASHAVALVQSATVRQALTAFPRSRPAGIALLAIAAIWSFALVQTMDLGEFTTLRTFMLLIIVVGAILAAIYVPEFLAVRALGMLALLAAEPILGAAFLRPELSRLLVVIIAYLWIFAGLFWVGMPFLLRDQIRWITSSPARFRAAAWAGTAYGAVVLLCAAILW